MAVNCAALTFTMLILNANFQINCVVLLYGVLYCIAVHCIAICIDQLATCHTLYTVDATEYVTAQTDATFHEGREKWRTVS